MHDYQKLPNSPSKILNEIFIEKKLRNKQYSLTAYSRDLGISTSRLSMILRGKVNISPKMANYIATRLNFDQEQIEYFSILANLKSTHSDEEKKNAFIKLRQLDTDKNIMSAEIFQVIANWYHLAIIELLSLKNAESDHKWIAKKLNITISEAEEAIQRLLKLEMIEETNDGKLIAVKDFTMVKSATPHKAGQEFHRQILTKAIHALEEQDTKTRNISTVVFKARKEDIPLIEEKIKRFRREISALLESGEEHDSVYSLGIQLVKLDM
jgi:uncharacterized protein (TIGR02147 family)